MSTWALLLISVDSSNWMANVWLLFIRSTTCSIRSIAITAIQRRTVSFERGIVLNLEASFSHKTVLTVSSAAGKITDFAMVWGWQHLAIHCATKYDAFNAFALTSTVAERQDFCCFRSLHSRLKYSTDFPLYSACLLVKWRDNFAGFMASFDKTTLQITHWGLCSLVTFITVNP